MKKRISNSAQQEMGARCGRPRHPATGTAALLAAAAVGATCSTAFAQSSVTIYGTLDLAAYSKQLSGEQRLNTLTSGILSLSRWNIRGTEDMGEGLRARFDMGSFIRLDTGESGRSATDSFWGRFAWVGLEGDAGLLRLGRITTPTFGNSVRFNPFGDGGVAPVLMHTFLPSPTQPMMTSQGAADSAWNNSINYSSPSVGGFDVVLQLAASEGTTAGRRASAGLTYSNGPLLIGLSVDDLSKMNLSFSKPPAVLPMQDSRTVLLGGSYDFAAVKLFMQAVQTKFDSPASQIKLRTGQLGIAVPVGAGRVLASYAHTTKDQTATADVKRGTLNAGYDHSFSKRTDAYLLVLTDKVTNLDRGTGFIAGMRHNF